MFIAECDVGEVKREASKLLKTFGVKHRLKKIEFKRNSKKEAAGHFRVAIERLQQKKINLQQYNQPVSVPAFLVDSCTYLRGKLDTDGLFRKPGVAIRQKELKQFLENGGQLTDDCKVSVADVADLLKMFFRELPEPCIPYIFHDILERCLNCEESHRETILLTLLLLPIDYLYTLAYILQFLQEVAAHWRTNRMDVSNLAVIWSPNLMPFKSGQVNDKSVLQKRLVIIQFLIENSSYVGLVPKCLCDHLSSCQPSCSFSSHEEINNSRHYKKKRRSGSLTRMLSGLKKIVRKSGSEETQTSPESPVPTPHTPRIMSSGKKRKASQSSLPTFSAKKRKDVLQSLPQGALLPDVCTTSSHTPRCQKKGQISHRTLSGTRLKLSQFGFNRRNKKRLEIIEQSQPDLTTTADNSYSPPLADDYLHISRREYEDIRNRVSIIESRISSEFENITGVSMSDLELTPNISELCSIKTVQSAYKKTLESAEKLNIRTTDELSRRFNRELKILGNSDKKVIRSPSARKIGTLRRRSKENTPHVKRNLSFDLWDKHNFFHQLYSAQSREPDSLHYRPLDPKLVTPNKSKDSLKHFTNEITGDKNFNIAHNIHNFPSFGMLTRSQVRKALSFNGYELSKTPPCQLPSKYRNQDTSVDEIDWKNAEDFLKEEKTEEKSVTGRPSVAKLRSQNAGMVHAKAQMFNTMVNTSNKSPYKTTKCRKDSSKTREIKKRNSSKTSKESKFQRKDLQNGGCRSRRDTLLLKKTNDLLISPSPKLEVNRKNNLLLGKGKKSISGCAPIQNSATKTPIQISKSLQNNFKSYLNCEYSSEKQLNHTASPNRHKTLHSVSGTRVTQLKNESDLIKKSPETSRKSLHGRTDPVFHRTFSSNNRVVRR